jgi:hypothetical protein
VLECETLPLDNLSHFFISSYYQMKNEHEEKWEGGKIMLKGFYKNFMAN